MATFTSSTFGNYTKKWLLITGLFELLLGTGFAVGAVAIEEVRGGFLLTAAILMLTGVALIWFGKRAGARAAEAERIDATGLAGVGTVTGLRQTGMYMNENPQVETTLLVQVPGRAPFEAKRKEFVPLILLSRLGVGSQLPVKVDPADTTKVIIDWDAPPPGLPGAFGGGTGAAGSGPAPKGPPLQALQAALASSPAAQEALMKLQASLAAASGDDTMKTQAVQQLQGALGQILQQGAGDPQVQAVQQLQAALGQIVAQGTGAAGQDESLQQVQSALAASGLQSAAVFSSPEQGGYTIEQLRAHLRSNGLQGTATINRLEDSGQTVGDERLFTMQVTVNVPGRPPHEAPMSAAMVPVGAVGKLAVGRTIPVRVDPTNPGVTMFEWDKV